ncbi:MAG: ester cyclase [Actinobacteria bacterium]|nr:ester cyclase [Actinomycetota bacterium]
MPPGGTSARSFDLSEWPTEAVPFGPAEVEGTFEWLRAGLSDLSVEILDLIAEEDRVVARILMTGTNDGDFAGLSATNREWHYEHVHIFGSLSTRSSSTGLCARI